MTAPRPRSSGATYVDAVPFAGDERRDPLRKSLDDLLTRSFYSAAGYVFESEPYTVPEDAPVFEALAAIRLDDRRHSHLLGELIQTRGGVPQPAVFPFWDLDLNYLSVPHLSGFVCGTIEREIADYETLLAAWPSDDAAGRATLEAIRNDKRAHLERLRPLSAAAVAREAATYAERIAARKKARAARLAKEKAEAEAAKRARAGAAAVPARAVAPAAPAKGPAPAAATPAGDLGDPDEPGISPKEKAKRKMARMRAAGAAPAGGVPAASAAPAMQPGALPAATPLAADVGDPDEPGISPKEKAKRKVARLRAASGAPPVAASAGAAPVVAPAPVVQAPADLGDPDEPGISPKEKAKRKVARMRAAGAAPVGGVPASSAAPAMRPAPSAAPAPMAADLGDPDEPGISPKEKAKRKVARMRAASGAPPVAASAGAAPADAPSPVVEAPADLGDPDEPGIPPKEKARRQIARMRAQRKT